MNKIKDILQKRVPKGHKRSSKWRKVRKKHVNENPFCAVCEDVRKLEVHHIEPFHVNPDRELDPANLVTLCDRKNIGCHYVFGHLKSWKSHNRTLEEDIEIWNDKIKNRP